MANERTALVSESNVAGFELPLDRLYHRGHTWVKADEDGMLTIGLDDFASRLTGVPDSVKLPAVGSHLSANGPAWEAKKKGVVARILSPVDGEVVETGSPEQGWMLKVRPSSEDLTHLLCPAEARLWLLREFERLQIALAGPQHAPMLAAGGAPLDDLSMVNPVEKLDELCAMVFLEP
ncbi:MAG: glycine cleavage system protein H [Thermoanaerobaculia bacterium]